MACQLSHAHCRHVCARECVCVSRREIIRRSIVFVWSVVASPRLFSHFGTGKTANSTFFPIPIFVEEATCLVVLVNSINLRCGSSDFRGLSRRDAIAVWEAFKDYRGGDGLDSKKKKTKIFTNQLWLKSLPSKPDFHGSVAASLLDPTSVMSFMGGLLSIATV